MRGEESVFLLSTVPMMFGHGVEWSLKMLPFHNQHTGKLQSIYPLWALESAEMLSVDQPELGGSYGVCQGPPGRKPCWPVLLYAPSELQC